MTHATALLVVILVIASLAVGWYGARAWIAHGDLAGTLRKVPGLKRARGSNSRIALIVVIIGLLVLYEAIRHK
jgi:hypothetical protein